MGGGAECVVDVSALALTAVSRRAASSKNFSVDFAANCLAILDTRQTETVLCQHMTQNGPGTAEARKRALHLFRLEKRHLPPRRIPVSFARKRAEWLNSACICPAQLRLAIDRHRRMPLVREEGFERARLSLYCLRRICPRQPTTPLTPCRRWRRGLLKKAGLTHQPADIVSLVGFRFLVEEGDQFGQCLKLGS